MLKLLRVYMSIYPFGSNSAKLEAVRSTPLIGAGGKTYIEKVQEQRKEII